MATRRRKTMVTKEPVTDFEIPGPQRLISFEVQNIMGVKAAYVDTDGKHIVLIGGDNGEGKSSLLTALEMAFRGKSSFPVKPIHEGAPYGTSEVVLTDLKVHLTVTHGGHTLRITDKNDRPIKKTPQKVLDQLFNELSFDPLKFARMNPPDQDAELKRIGGIEKPWAALEIEEKTVYADRTEVNREVKRYAAQLEGMPWNQDAPTEERSSKDVLVELDELISKEREQERQGRAKRLKLEDDLRALEDTAARARRHVDESAEAVRASVADIRKREVYIQELKDALETAEDELDSARDTHKEALRREELATEAVDALPDLAAKRAELETLVTTDDQENPLIAAKRAELETLEQRNRQVRENKARVSVRKALNEAEAESEAKTRRLAEIENTKAGLLENATFPIEGLGFSSLGPTFNGIPIAQISTSERIRLSCAIGFAQNPTLKLLIVKDAAFLDKEGLRLMAELAEEHDGLVILERVGTDDETAIIIEDGTVVREPVAAE